MRSDEYEEADFAFIRDLFDRWVPDPAEFPRWAGVAQENRAISPDPEPTGEIQAPTTFAGWVHDYHDLDGCYDEDVAPVRQGRLTIALYTELLAGKGALRKLRKSLRALLATADPEGPLSFDLDEIRVQRMGPAPGGTWFIEHMIVPFTGG